MVINISKEEIIRQAKVAPWIVKPEDAENLILEVINVRTANFNKEIGKYECGADLKMTFPNGGTNNLPITFTSELADDGKNYYVSVNGLR